MYAKGKKNGSVSFKVAPQGSVKKAFLAGSFSDWKPVAMKKQKDGCFAATVDLAPGRYEYKFILDEQWIHDADVPGVVANRFGSLNSIAVIK